MIKCKYCGFENDEEALYCGGCGHKIEDESTYSVIQEDVSKDTEDKELGFDIEENPVDEAPETKDSNDEDLGFVIEDEETPETKDANEDELGFDLEKDKGEDLGFEVEEKPEVSYVEHNSKKSNKGMIIAGVIALLIVGAVGGGFMTVQNNKHKAEIVALKEEQKKKEDTAKEEAEKSKKEAEEAKKEAAKARETSTETKESNDANKPATGSYVANYNMKEREGASLSSNQVGHIKKGDTLEIVEIIDNGDGSYWGKLSNGHYVCVKDNEYIYLS